MQNKKFIFLIFTVLGGSFLLSFFIDYQPFLSQGDHGRDLYAFEATLRGEAPYRDYWWVYGPLMPYYYSLFFKFLGTQIPSILLGKALLNLLSGVLVFLILTAVISPIFAFAGALWFWVFNPDFFYTYNHPGGITMLLAATYALFLYLQNPRTAYILWGLASITVLAFIKLNFGLSSLLVFLASIFLIDTVHKSPVSMAKKQIYLFSFFMLPPLILLTYFGLLADLCPYEIRECFPYLQSDQQYYISISDGIKFWSQTILSRMTASPTDALLSLVVVLCLIKIILTVLTGDNQKSKREISLALAISGFFYIVNLHEYIHSGIVYRLAWSEPYLMLLTFIIIFYATQSLGRLVQTLLLSAVLLITGLTAMNQIQAISTVKTADHYISHTKGKIFANNSWPWIDTVQKTSQYLEQRLQKEDLFFAMPYDPIFYYLTGRKSPTRQLIFFDHINIPAEQELKVISQLDAERVNYIVLSNRLSAKESGLGTFGQTYCPTLKKYIDEHFVPVQVFGDWEHEPGWAWNYGTIILKRK